MLLPRFFLLVIALFATACDEPASDAPYMEIVGGGFILNYRLAEANYGFVAHVKRDLPEGTVLEARFEDPAGGPAIVVRHYHNAARKGYKFETPPLQGVLANKDYLAELRLIDPTDGKMIARYSRSFRTFTGQDVLPDKPLTVGPGHHPNIPADTRSR